MYPFESSGAIASAHVFGAVVHKGLFISINVIIIRNFDFFFLFLKFKSFVKLKVQIVFRVGRGGELEEFQAICK